MIVVLYYVCLIILSGYAAHRIFIIFLYKKYYKNKPPKPKRVQIDDPSLPMVTIQIPLYNEVFVVRRILRSVAKIKYPREKLQIQILDDSTDKTRSIAESEVRRMIKGLDIKYYHRDIRNGFKAGALREGLRKAKGEIIAIFDADFLPNEDFLLKTVAYFGDKRVGIIQTRWSYLNSTNSILTRIQKILLDAHFQLEHTARAYSGRFVNFNGTAGLLRKSAILEAGGWQDDTLTEDLDISYRMQLKNYRIVYLPFVECLSELPSSLAAFKRQQFRWTKGSIQVAKKLFFPLTKAELPIKVKIEALMHLCAPMAYVLLFVLSLILPLLVTKVVYLVDAGIEYKLISFMSLFLITISSYLFLLCPDRASIF